MEKMNKHVKFYTLFLNQKAYESLKKTIYYLIDGKKFQKIIIFKIKLIEFFLKF